jgi:hypothetical protein
MHESAVLPLRTPAWETARMSARLKVDLLAEGLRIGPGVEEHLAEHGKPPLRVRSGSCGGLDLVLPGGIYANCPVNELFAAGSPYLLRRAGSALQVEDTRSGAATDVTVTPCPAYYHRRSSRTGVPLSQLGQLCSDRLGIGLTNGCSFWARPETRCRFCSIGLNVRSGHEVGRKSTIDVLEVADAAVDDPVAPSRHVLLGGGTPPGPDAGAIAIADATRALKARYPGVLVYAMVAPPADASYVELLVAAGVDELGINLEVWSDAAADLYLSGKRAVGRDHYLRMLGTAVAAFRDRERSGRAGSYPSGVGRVRSIMIVGLESGPDVLRGVEALACRGVMPILTPFRPMRGTEMERHPRWSGDALWKLTAAATTVAGRHDLPLGPTCVPCQANTLNLPGHPAYRSY